MTAGGGWEKVLQVWWAGRARATGNVAALSTLSCRAGAGGGRCLARPGRWLDLALSEPAVGTALG